MSDSVELQIAQLEDLTSSELRDLWQRLTRGPVPRVSPKLLRLALAWEIQARAYGGLARATKRSLAELDGEKERTLRTQAGTRLIREWQGKVHVVTVGDDQIIRWNDGNYRSLSEVARAITGTRWSGPAFFGLKQRKVAA